MMTALLLLFCLRQMIVYLINDHNIHSEHTENYVVESISDKKNQIFVCAHYRQPFICEMQFSMLNICVNLI